MVKELNTSEVVYDVHRLQWVETEPDVAEPDMELSPSR